MGITGLLPFLEQATRTCNISEFRGATVAVDSYCWLHKGASACAEVLARGEDSDIYVNYCMKYVFMLKKYDIKPIMVFDGARLPAKELTEKKRRENRKNAKVRALELLRLGKKEEAWNYFRQCVDITPKMAHKLIVECRRNNVDCIVAPYESDSQLAFLNLKGLAEIVITEDSDLVLFGCTKVFFKLDLNGNGRLVEKEKIPNCMKMKPDQYTFDKFRYTCILSGCDYLDSLPGIGLKKALKFFQLTAEEDPLKFLDKVPRYLNLKCEVTEGYKDEFMVADATFRHQVVFDPTLKKLTHLNDPALNGTRPEYCRKAGTISEDEIAFQVAIGNLDPSTHEKYDNWSPTELNLGSIWSEFYVKKTSRKAQKELKKRTEHVETKCSDFFTKKHEADQELFDAQLEIYKPEALPQNNCDNVETIQIEDVSPVLARKKFVNPFLKKNRITETIINPDKTIVRSKYFHKNDAENDSNNHLDKALEICDEIIENEDSLITLTQVYNHSKTGSETDNKKRKLGEMTEANKQKTPKKSKMIQCRQMGLSKTKNQPTLHTLFANMKSKKT